MVYLKLFIENIDSQVNLENDSENLLLNFLSFIIG